MGEAKAADPWVLESRIMAVETIYRADRNAAGTVFMLLSVVGFSVIPLLIANGGGEQNPFLFAASLKMGVFFGLAIFLAVMFRDVLFNATVIQIIVQRLPTWSMLFMLINQFEYALFGLAIRFVDVSVAAVLFETWPIAVILLTASLFRRESRYGKIRKEMLLLLVMGFIGFWFVAASQSGSFGNLGDAQFGTTLVGIGLVVMAAFAAAVAAYGIRWGVDLRRALPPNLVEHKDIELVEVCCVLIANTVAHFVGSVLAGLVGFSTGESLDIRILIYALAAGGVAHTVATMAWRAANLMTTNLGINALSYATPVVTLVWLFLFAEVDIARTDYLIMGAAAIITANLLINFEAEVRFGFKAMILALWVCGAFVYLRDDFMIYLPFEGWLWPRETYLGALGLSATIFTLLLTFRIARLAPRTQDEDNRIFALHRSLELLAQRNLIASEATRHIRGIDSARTPEELRLAYTQVKLCFAEATAEDLPPSDQRLLADVEAQLNMMVHSRQQGLEFGELFSLIIFGGATVLLSLVSRPEVEGWTAFLLEVFSTLFPAVIIFLITNVWDLHRDRADLVLANQQNSQGFGVIFRDARSRRFEQSVSLVVGLLIIIAYAGLLWYKWVG